MAKGAARRRRASRAPSSGQPQPAVVQAVATGEHPPAARRRLARGRIATAVAFVVLTPVLVIVADRDAPLALHLRLAGSMLLFQGAILAAAMLPPRTLQDHETRRRNPLIPLLAILAGAALLVTLSLPVGAWFAGLAMFLALMIDALRRRDNRPGWIPFALGVAFAVCWVVGGANRWDALVWWLFPFALLSAIALNAIGLSPPDSTKQTADRRRAGIAIACLGVLCSIAALLLIRRAPGQAVFIAIEGAFALLLIPRTARRFGRQGIFGLMSAACLLTGAVFVSAVG